MYNPANKSKAVKIVGAIAVIAILGWFLSRLDGRIAIVASGTSTATTTLVAIATPSSDATLPPSTPIPRVQGERLEVCESDICIVGSDGSSTSLGLDDDYQIHPSFGFSPDGSQVVFNACSQAEIQQNPAYEFCHDLFIANRDGSVTRLTDIPNIPETYPSWSPDGEWIAFGAWQFSIIRPDGTGFTTLVSDPAIGNVYASAWSPDSQQIAFVSGDYNFDIEWGFQNEVSIINRDGSGRRMIFKLPEPNPVREDWITEIAWSPDGQSLAITFDDGRAYMLNINCEAGKADCGLSDLTEIPEIPQSWLDTFHPQWSNNVTADPTSMPSPLADQARTFAEPILQAIADSPPDFADDFSTNSQGWQLDGWCGQIADGSLGASINPERMVPQSDGRYTCGAHNPAVLGVTNFVFEVDLAQTQAEVQGFAGVQWRHTDGYYRVAVNVPGRRWTLERSSTSLPGGVGLESLQEWQGPASGRIQVISRGSQFAVYIDETPVFYLEDDLNPSGEIDLWLNAPDGSVAVEYDNVKIWNLDNPPGLP